MKTKAIILVGGRGTRLKKLSTKVPKPMVKVAGIPILEHQIRLLKEYGFTRITLITNYLSEVIESYFKDGNRFGVKIDYLREKKPLSTAGGIKELKDKLTSDFVVFYGDIMVNMNLGKLLKFHRARRSSCTLVLHPNDHPYDSDLVEINEDKRITHFYSKPHAVGRYFRNLVSAGIYVVSPGIIKYIKKGVKADFGRDIFPKIVSKERLFGYNTAEYIKDVGTPARLKQVRKDCQSGKIKRLNSEHKRPAIFLDRDGVINEKAGLLYKVEDFKLLNRAAKAIKKINESDFLAIVVTNQPVIARNLCSVERLEEMHKKMDTLLGREGAKVDAVYCCPHHPDKGYPGENLEYKIDCQCRKPKIGMIEKAREEFNIDLESSFLLGDSCRDILCGKNAGLTTIGLMTGDGCKEGDIEPDYFFEDLYQAVEFIINAPFRPFFEKVDKCFSNSDKQPFVVSIVGNSRSGKTTLAEYIAREYKGLGKKAMLIKLDNWILSKQDRTKSHNVYERFQIEKIDHDLRDLFAGKEIILNKYQPLSQNRTNKKISYQLNCHDLVIIEGVVAQSSEQLRKISQLKLYCEVDDDLFCRRIKKFYLWKGFDKTQIKELLGTRAKDEYQLIEGDKAYADMIISV